MWSLEWKPLDEGYEEEAIKILNSWEFKRFDVKFPHRYDPQRRFRVNRDRKRRPDNHSVETLGVILRHQLQCLLSRHTRVWGPYGVFELLKLAKKILLRVVPPHDWVGVGKIRNVELIWQEIKKNTVDWVPSEITKWLGDILEQHCAPMREPPRQKMSNRIGAPGKIALPKKDVSQILVEGLKLLFRVLKTMEKYGWESPTYRFHPEPTPETGGDENGTIALTDSMHKPPQTISNGVSDWSIYGEVMGNSITALPDSGADVCFISPETSMLLGLDPQPGTERLVRLADGRELVSPGAVDVPWNFRDEEETFDITCWILPGCGHQIILGSKFLEETKCLTTHRYRIQRKHISAPKYVRVNLIGEGKQWLSGLLNDIPVAALPDTGSDVMVMSRDYAWRVGLKVDSSPEDIVEVEFADGTTALTNGIVRDVIWSSGGHSIQCDFLVLNNLAVDVILAKDYLFDVDAFSNYRAHLIEDEDTEHLDIYGIRLVREFGERFGETLDQLEDDSIEDVISQDAFSPTMINREWARRDRIRDEIEALDENKRAETEAAEERHQEQWEKARVEHRRRWAQAQTPTHPQVSIIERLGSSHPTSERDTRIADGSGGGAAPGRLAPPGNVMRHFRWLKRPRVSIPLLPLRRNGISHTSEHAG